MFVQATKSRRKKKTYVTYLVRESFRTPDGPRSRTICNISKLPEDVRKLVTESLSGRTFVESKAIELEQAFACGGLTVLVDAWSRIKLDQVLKNICTPRQRAHMKAMVFSRLLFSWASLSLKDQARDTLLASACGLSSDEGFDEDDLDAAGEAITGHWVALEKDLAAGAFKEPVTVALHKLTSNSFGGAVPNQITHYRQSPSIQPQIILALAIDTSGTPLHLSTLRGDRLSTLTFQGLLKILGRRFGIREAVFVFDEDMNSESDLEAIEKNGFHFVTRTSNAALEILLEQPPEALQTQPRNPKRFVEIKHEGKRHVFVGGLRHNEHDRERCHPRLAKAEKALARLAAVKRKKPDAQKIANQARLILERLKAHKYFTYRVDESGLLLWQRKAEAFPYENPQDGRYLLHTNLTSNQADASEIQRHHKNLLEVEEAFCELKSHLRLRPFFRYYPKRILNHVRISFLAYYVAARLAKKWRAPGGATEVSHILREIQTIRLGQISVGTPNAPLLSRLTKVSAHLNPILVKYKLLHLLSTVPQWAAFPPKHR